MVRLAIDYENPGRRWWDSGGQELWEAILESPDGVDVVLDAALAQSWLAQAAALDGWDDGPPYAPHPITLHTVDEDEDV